MQNKKTFSFDKIVISSDFQSGNLSKSSQKDPTTFQLWIQPDPNSSYKTWFYFSIDQIPQLTTFTFIIKNMSNQLKLFKEGHLPVVRAQSQQKWQKIKIPIQQNGIVKSAEGYQLTFKYNFNKKQKHFFAFSYPFSNFECEKFITRLMTYNKQNIYSSYSTIGYSTQKRQLKLLTVTTLPKQSNQWKQLTISQLEQKILVFNNKKGIFISARVHPGEVASSHILNGFLQFLFSYNAQAQILLKNCVFYVVPIINPDGVAMGNFRTDCNGKNLNRYYTNPNKQMEPEIYTIKKFLVQMIKNKQIQFCLDLHAHVNKQGSFIYGNSINDLKGQVQVCLFPKILAYNCQLFDFDACNFSQKNMNSKDKTDQLSKEGASRVAIYKQTGLRTCWTLQCNYNSSKYKNQLNKLEPQQFKTVSNGVLTQKTFPNKKQQQIFYGLNQFYLIGCSIGQSIVDFYGYRETARFYVGKMKNRLNFQLNLAVQILRMIPFRFDNECRKILSNLNSNLNLTENLLKLSKILNKNQIIIGQKFFMNKIQPKKTQSVKNIENDEKVKNTENYKPKQQISQKQIVLTQNKIIFTKMIKINSVDNKRILKKTESVKVKQGSTKQIEINPISLKQIQPKIIKEKVGLITKRVSVKKETTMNIKFQQK